ncbi:MAG: biotin/lipoyl-binding protein [Pirellulales bacterium]
MKYRLHTTVTGTVLANQSVSLSNEIAGTVSKVGFEPGDVVEKDQVLIELDTSVERAQPESSSARAQIAASNLKRTCRRAVERSTVAEVEEADAQFQQAAADVQQLEAVIAKKTCELRFEPRSAWRIRM